VRLLIGIISAGEDTGVLLPMMRLPLLVTSCEAGLPEMYSDSVSSEIPKDISVISSLDLFEWMAKAVGEMMFEKVGVETVIDGDVGVEKLVLITMFVVWGGCGVGLMISIVIGEGKLLYKSLWLSMKAVLQLNCKKVRSDEKKPLLTVQTC
jgi:hypothetical protein